MATTATTSAQRSTWTQQQRHALPEELVVIFLQLVSLPKTMNDNDGTEINKDDNSYGFMNGYRYRLRIIDSIETLQKKNEQRNQRIMRENDVSTSLSENRINVSASLQQQQQYLPRETRDVPLSRWEWLSQTESQLNQIRKEIHEFHTFIIPQERQQIISFQQQLICQHHHHQQRPAIYTLLLRLFSEYQIQWQYEEQMIRHVLHPTLDTWYNNDINESNLANTAVNDSDTNPTNVSLQFCIQILRRMWTIQEQEQYFHDNIELLLQLIEEEPNEIIPNVHDRHPGVTIARWQSSLSLVQQQFKLLNVRPDKGVPNNLCMEHKSIDNNPLVDDGIVTTSSVHGFTDSVTICPNAGRNSIIDEAVDVMHRRNTATDDIVKTILIIGSHGTGKTYLCNQLEERLSLASHLAVSVIRPKLPMDLLREGALIGAMEDTIISLFTSIQGHIFSNQNVVVILDDVEHIVGSFGSTGETQLVRRCRSIFMAMLDCIQYRQTSYNTYNSTLNSNVLLFLTTSCQEIATSMSFNFSRIFHLEPPNEKERKRVLQNFTAIGYDCNDAQNDDDESIMLKDLVDLTVGKSFAEIVQICRQSVDMVSASCHDSNNDVRVKSSADKSNRRLVSMKNLLQSQTPESLRGGENIDGYVNMRVFTARDLLSMKQTGIESTILPSRSANAAWKALKSSIIIPLCRSKELYELLDTTKHGKPRTMTGAVLLTGESGSGKTVMALRCATYAAELLPSIKLIDVSCTSMIHKEVGASEQAIHHLFDAARRAAPAILLMDGIETIAAVRGNDATTEGTMDRILSTLLVELDGIDDNLSNASQGGIAVIGITHDETWIDPALKRPGRLDRAIHMARDWI